jgi:hypothetical protein
VYIIKDHAFNAVFITPVQDVQWNYRNDPTKVVFDFGAGIMTEDMRPLGSRRTEIFITACQTKSGMDDNTRYATAEQSWSVTLAPGNMIALDTESITEFQKVSEDHVVAASHIAVYMTPNPNSREGIFWQQVGGKAVAFFDYELDMKRIRETFTLNNGSTHERACARTPKDFIQCE